MITAEELEKFLELKSKGALTEDEFNYYRHQFLVQEFNKPISSERLEKMFDLKNKGLISEQDFNAYRDRFLAQDTRISTGNSETKNTDKNFNQSATNRIMGVVCLILIFAVIIAKILSFEDTRNAIKNGTHQQVQRVDTASCLRDVEAKKNLIWIRCLETNVNPSYLSAGEKMVGMQYCQTLMERLHQSCYE